jgi:hypothetical protein
MALVGNNHPLVEYLQHSLHLCEPTQASPSPHNLSSLLACGVPQFFVAQQLVCHSRGECGGPQRKE